MNDKYNICLVNPGSTADRVCWDIVVGTQNGLLPCLVCSITDASGWRLGV